jgi:uncharacterized protein YxeA
MKKTLLTMIMLLTLTMGVEAAAQKHRHTPRNEQELVDTTQKGGIEAFSDTTTIADSATYTYSSWDEDEADDSDFSINALLSDIDGKDFAGMMFVLAVLMILFVLAPVFIIIALFYFINKNRKEKMRLAQMAMQQGQPIPEQLLEEKSDTVSDEYQKGLRQCFVGVGLMVFLYIAAGEIGFGIGALVFCIGLGKIVAGKLAEKKTQNFNQ